jgi:hypothetical protein
MVQVSVYTRDAAGLTRVATLQLVATSDLPGWRMDVDPPSGVPDGVVMTIRSQLLAGAACGNVDWWHWRKEK